MTDGGVINLEHGFSQEAIDRLSEMGHNVKVTKGGFGGYQAVMYDEINGVHFRP